MNCGSTSENECEKALRRSPFFVYSILGSVFEGPVFSIQTFCIGVKRFIFRALTQTDLLGLIELAYFEELSRVSCKCVPDKIAWGFLHHFYGYLICF